MPDKVQTATLTAEQPVNPTGSKPDAPIFTSISTRVNVPVPNGTVLDFVPEFHYVAPNGNAIVLHCEIVYTGNTQIHINAASPIIAPPDAGARPSAASGGHEQP